MVFETWQTCGKVGFSVCLNARVSDLRFFLGREGLKIAGRNHVAAFLEYRTIVGQAADEPGHIMLPDADFQKLKLKVGLREFLFWRTFLISIRPSEKVGMFHKSRVRNLQKLRRWRCMKSVTRTE